MDCAVIARRFKGRGGDGGTERRVKSKQAEEKGVATNYLM